MIILIRLFRKKNLSKLSGLMHFRDKMANLFFFKKKALGYKSVKKRFRVHHKNEDSNVVRYI